MPMMAALNTEIKNPNQSEYQTVRVEGGLSLFQAIDVSSTTCSISPLLSIVQASVNLAWPKLVKYSVLELYSWAGLFERRLTLTQG